jgi:hypothetical protein
MSAMPPIAAELMRWGELTPCARLRREHLQQGHAQKLPFYSIMSVSEPDKKAPLPRGHTAKMLP